MTINIARGNDFELSDGPELQDSLPAMFERGRSRGDREQWSEAEDAE